MASKMFRLVRKWENASKRKLETYKKRLGYEKKIEKQDFNYYCSLKNNNREGWKKIFAPGKNKDHFFRTFGTNADFRYCLLINEGKRK